MAIDIKEQVQRIIRESDLWSDFLDAVTEELVNVKTEIEEKQRYLNPSLYTEVADLVALSRSLGYSPNLSLKEDLEFVQQEVESIVFKIKNKATYAYYRYLFKLIPKAGAIYIIYKDYLKLLRIADVSTTVSSLASHDKTAPFTGFLPVEHFDQYRSEEVQLDAVPLFYLDSDVAWRLDQDLVINPTKHIAAEYLINELITKNGTDYLLTEEYFTYLRKGMEYGRKAVDIPHPGCNLSIVIDDSGVYDNQNPGAAYSIPTLKLKAATTPVYTTEVTPTYFKFGTGQKDLLSSTNQEILQDLLLHLEFEDQNTEIMQDESPNNNDATVSGSFVLVDGVSGQGLHFNGINTEALIEDFTYVATDDKTLAMWIKPDRFGQIENQAYIYSSSSIDISYDKTTEELKFNVGGVANEVAWPANDFDNHLLFIMLTIEYSTSILSIYVNNVLQDQLTNAAYQTVAESDGDVYIGSDNGSGWFRGMIDSVRVYNKLIALSDRNYLYTNKPGTLRMLSNELYTSTLSTNQYRTIDDWFYATSIYPANSRNKELVAVGDDVTSSFSGITDFANIKPNTFSIRYFSFPSYYTITDDGEGSLEGDAASGTINYASGEYSFTTSLLKSIVQEGWYTAESKTTIETYTANQNVYPGTFNINFWIGDANYTVEDDGNGEITGTGISDGEINYNTGYVTITFSSPTDAGKDIYVYYDYVANSVPADSTLIEASYKTTELIEVTEAGVYDEDDNMIVYATFPPTEFENTLNHLAIQFFVQNS